MKKLIIPFLICLAQSIAWAAPNQQGPVTDFSSLEKKVEGRIGLAAIQSATGRELLHRADERFLMCSTFKALLAAQILQRVDNGEEKMDRVLPVAKSDLVTHSPEVEKRVGKGMTVKDLCIATVQVSDNAAANLLLGIQGGPKGFTEFMRSIGDKTTRLDRFEPMMSKPDGELDKSSPRAMAHTLKTLLYGTALKPESRKILLEWLLGNKTGDKRLKAGLPPNWRIGEKTGTGSGGETNDIGVIFPPSGEPIFIAAFLSDSKKPLADREAVLAEIGRIVAKEFARSTK